MKPPAQPYVPAVKLRRTPGARRAIAAAVVFSAVARVAPVLESLPLGET
jgi:hypothetical protein